MYLMKCFAVNEHGKPVRNSEVKSIPKDASREFGFLLTKLWRTSERMTLRIWTS